MANLCRRGGEPQETSLFSLFLDVCEEARAQTAGRGTELPLPPRCPARFN